MSGASEAAKVSKTSSSPSFGLKFRSSFGRSCPQHQVVYFENLTGLGLFHLEFGGVRV